jgi:general secretion pathway protein F
MAELFKALITGAPLSYNKAKVRAKRATVFQDSDQELPGITIFVISLNEFLTEHSLTIFSILFVLILGVKLLLKKPNVKEKMQRLLVKAPAFGKVLITTNAIRFARTFALLYESGAPVISALNNSAMALNYLPMRQAITNRMLKIVKECSVKNSFKLMTKIVMPGNS